MWYQYRRGGKGQQPLPTTSAAQKPYHVTSFLATEYWNFWYWQLYLHDIITFTLLSSVLQILVLLFFLIPSILTRQILKILQFCYYLYLFVGYYYVNFKIHSRGVDVGFSDDIHFRFKFMHDTTTHVLFVSRGEDNHLARWYGTCSPGSRPNIVDTVG